jgi:hypothetical protein
MNARHSASPPSAAPPPRSATYVKNDEKCQSPQCTQSSTVALASSSLEAISERLTTIVAVQDRKINVLMQDNVDLRDEVRNFSRALQSSKRDLQRVENIMTRTASEMKVELENMLEKSENRLLGPMGRLLEELRSIRANPPAPVHVPVVTAFPSTASYPPEPPAGNSEWTTRDDYAHAEPNKPHYQENYEKHRQPVRLTCQFITS